MMAGRVVLAVALLAAVPLIAAQAPLGNPPYAIAHRGLSGAFPEHTLRAYRAAIDMGADFIECDVVATRDCKLICRHEPELSATTDALDKFPAQNTTYNIDGTDVSGVFAFDLTLAEIRTLRAVQQNPLRDQSYNGLFQVPTLQEYIRTAQAAPRVVGIYPETKHPGFHDGLNLECWGNRSFTEAVVDVLTQFGYNAEMGTPEWKKRPAFLQSFERQNLEEVANRTKLPKVFLTDEFDKEIPLETYTYGEVLRSPKALEALKSFGVRGIGPWKNTLVSFTDKNYVNKSTIPAGIRTVQRLKAAGFQVHIYTLRNEPKRPDGSGYLAWDYVADPVFEYELFFKKLGVDGAFSDQVHTLARYLGRTVKSPF